MRWTMWLDRLTLTAAAGTLFLIPIVVAGCGDDPEAGPHQSPRQFAAGKISCMNNQRQLAGLLEMRATERNYPTQVGGANLVLYFVKRGTIRPGHLEVLFCAMDTRESLQKAGGIAEYKNLNLEAATNGHLTSYAGRDQTDPKCRVTKGDFREAPMFSDDSPDHHMGRGIVVAYAGAAVRWRDAMDDYAGKKIRFGPDAEIEELRCLSAD